jgi:hypothetical protein
MERELVAREVRCSWKARWVRAWMEALTAHTLNPIRSARIPPTGRKNFMAKPWLLMAGSLA